MPVDASAWELLVLAAAGLAAGYINSIAGAGSLLTLPALIFTGLDAGAANATNRVAVLFQNAAAIFAYRRGGVRTGGLGWRLAFPTAAFAAAGAWVATLLSDAELRLAIAIAMVVFLVLSLVRRRGGDEDGDREPPPFRWGMVVGFAAIGFYAGFLQAGVGILILLYMSLVHGADLVVSNAIKVVVILVLTVVALATFVVLGETVDPLRGLVLATATTLGGYFGAQASVKRGEGFVRVVLVTAVLASVVKLAWDSLSGG